MTKNSDRGGKLSLSELKALYLQTQDVTEIRFAKEYFSTYETWLLFVEKNQSHIDMWRKELELTLKQEAYDSVITVMREDDKNKLAAAKFLLQKGILNRDGKEMVTEAEVKERAKKKASRVDNDYLRLVIKNA